VIRHSALALVLLAAGTVHAADKKFDRTFAVSPGGTLTVDADSATVEVSGAETNQVTVRMSARGSEKDLADLRFDAAQAGDGVTVTLKRNKEKNGWFSSRSWNSEERIQVTVPKRYVVRVRTGGGNVELQDTTGTALLKTSGGDIAAKNVNGNLELRTSGGGILAENIRGDVDADTSGGDIRLLRIDGKIQGHTSGGSVRCSLVGANREISATTSGGDIELLLPRGTQGTVKATTSGGSVRSDLPVTAESVKEGRIEGTLNGGGALIRAHTSGGSITLRQAD
jgi:DUF4097 and DUF4098 domain-containing protein YvlB